MSTSKPYITDCEADGSTAYEWIYNKTLRVMLSVEADGSVIWSIVGFDLQVCDSGYMPEKFIQQIIERNQ